MTRSSVLRWLGRSWQRGLFALGERLGVLTEFTPGVVVTQKGGGTDRLVLWVGAVLPVSTTADAPAVASVAVAGGPERTLELTPYDLGDEREISGWHATGFHHAHVVVGDLPADSWFDVEVSVAGRTAGCRARTLPHRLADAAPLSVFAGSCYDADTDTDPSARPPTRSFPDGIDLSLLVGDQIYADAPWWFYALVGAQAPRTNLLLEYWTAWGRQRARGVVRTGLADVLGAGPTWFLPDDHEFWNNWPHYSFTAQHSFLHQAKGVLGGLRRFLFGRGLGPLDEVELPPQPGPTRGPDGELHLHYGPRQQSYLPVHPDEWDTWSRAAFELFGSFQTPSRQDRAALDAHGTGRITRGAAEDRDPHRPPGDVTTRTLHAPLTPPVQSIRIDPLVVALLDTRTRRTRRLRHPRYSAFVDEEYLQEMLSLAASADVFVLAMPQPALTEPAWFADRHRPDWWPALDRGIHDYWFQYQRFWTGLIEARDGRPTVTVAGDIHRSYVAHVPSLALVEIVASPISLVRSPLPDQRADLPGRLEVERLASGPMGTANALLAGRTSPNVIPAPGRWGRPDVLASLDGAGAARNGFARLAFARDGDDVSLTVSLVPRDPRQAATPDRRLLLRTGVRGEKAVIEGRADQA